VNGSGDAWIWGLIRYETFWFGSPRGGSFLLEGVLRMKATARALPLPEIRTVQFLVERWCPNAPEGELNGMKFPFPLWVEYPEYSIDADCGGKTFLISPERHPGIGCIPGDESRVAGVCEHMGHLIE